MQRRQSAGIEEGIGQGDLAECRRYPVAQQQARHRFAQAADDRMVFGGDTAISPSIRITSTTRAPASA